MLFSLEIISLVLNYNICFDNLLFSCISRQTIKKGDFLSIVLCYSFAVV